MSTDKSTLKDVLSMALNEFPYHVWLYSKIHESVSIFVAVMGCGSMIQCELMGHLGLGGAIHL